MSDEIGYAVDPVIDVMWPPVLRKPGHIRHRRRIAVAQHTLDYILW